MDHAWSAFFSGQTGAKCWPKKLGGISILLQIHTKFSPNLVTPQKDMWSVSSVRAGSQKPVVGSGI
jgi:hypothetical protein